jgi:hypothetical protein
MMLKRPRKLAGQSRQGQGRELGMAAALESGEQSMAKAFEETNYMYQLFRPFYFTQLD